MIGLGDIAKRGYVQVMRVLARPVRWTGLMGLLEQRRGLTARWARSLFAIHDIDDMIRLDLPWWTFSAIAAVEAHLALRPGAKVFEYGSGASTIWLARRAGSVTSVEHDPGWYAHVGSYVADHDHVRLLHRPPAPAGPGGTAFGSSKGRGRGMDFESYVTEIAEHQGPFDVIVIDGRAREACLQAALPHLAAGGMIVYDNAGRARYRAGIEAAGLELHDLRGLTPALPYPEHTALLLAPGPGG